MPFIILLVLFSVIPFAIASLTGQKFEETVSLFSLAVVCTGFLLGIFGLVRLTPYLIILAGAFSFVYLLYITFIQKTFKVHAQLTFGYFAFVVLAAAAWWLCRGRMLTFWDEFTHWGLAVKNMFYLDGLYTLPASTTTYTDYPPAMPIFIYSFLKAIRSSFREDVALFIQCLFSISLLVYPLHKFRWRAASLGTPLIIILFLVPAGLNSHFYTRLLVDGILGILCAFILYTHYFGSGQGRVKTFIYTSLACLALTATKAIGMPLAVLCAGLTLLDSAVFKKGVFAVPQNIAWQNPAKQKGKSQNTAAQFKATCKNALPLTAPFLAVLLGWAGWKVHLRLFAVPPVWNTSGLSLQNLAAFLNGTAPAYRYETLQNFIKAFFVDKAYGTGLTFATGGWVLVLLALMLCCLLLAEKPLKRRLTLCFFYLAFMYILYEVGTLLNFLFVFSEGEAVALASYYRYEATMLTCLLIFLITALLTLLLNKPLHLQLSLSLISLCLVFYTCPTTLSFLAQLPNAPLQAAKTQHERYLSIQVAQRITALGEQVPKVYLVSITDDNLALFKAIYELTPVQFSNPMHQTSIAISESIYGPETGYHGIYTPQEWAQLLSESYEYVYLFNIDGYFTTYYRPLFEEEDDIVNDVMLDVVHHPDGTITLRRHIFS